MSFSIRRFVKILSLGATLFAPAYAATNPRIAVRPTARIVEKIDNAKVTTIVHSHSAKVAGLTDLGRLDPHTALHKISLVLKSSDEQEYALAKLLDQQQDKSHENYHQWVTPEVFGATFGVESSDLAKITGWLQSSGFKIDKVANGARIIQFSGTAGSVESAFHTEMHTYLVNGEKRVSNATDISIPTALTPVVRGIARLNNFRPNRAAPSPVIGQRDADGTMHAAANPLYTNPATPVSGTASAHYVGGADYAALYDTAPLLAKGINGQGVSIGLVETSDLLLSDVETYRSIFGLPVNQPTIVQTGPDSGLVTDDQEVQSVDIVGPTDAEVSGAVAPMASIYYVSSGTNLFDFSEVDNAAVYLVDNNLTDIISMNYGVDEADAAAGLAGNEGTLYGIFTSYPDGDLQFFQTLWEQAAAQGQSVFVSSGIGGPDEYDIFQAAYNNETVPESGTYSVNMYASTPFNVAVGSTEFNEGSTTAYAATGATSFWGAAATAPPYATALGYIPENTWNIGKYGTVNGASVSGAAGIYSSGGGVSQYNALPNWQNFPNISLTTDPLPNSAAWGSTTYNALPSTYLAVTPGPHRLLPDVSMPSGNGHDGTMICYEGNCTLTSAGLLNSFGLVSGTTAATASMAGIQALINQANGGRQGNPNFFYYKIAAAQNETTCNSTTYPLLPTAATASCGFHDITVGNSAIPTSTKGTAEIGWNAETGYDLTTGLGSPDAANLSNLWSAAAAKFQPTTVGLNIVDYNNSSTQTNPIVIAHGDDLQVSINVYPVNSSGQPIAGTPTGDVALIAQTTSQGGVGFYNITNYSQNQTTQGCAGYTGPSVNIPSVTVATTGSATVGYLETLTFTGNVAAGNVDEIPNGDYVYLTGLTGPFAVLNNSYQLVTAATGTTFSIQVGAAPYPITAAALTATSGTGPYVYTLTFTSTVPLTKGGNVLFAGLTGSYAFLNGTNQTVTATSGTSFQIQYTSATALTITGTSTGSAASDFPATTTFNSPYPTGVPDPPALGTTFPSPLPCGGVAGDGNAYDALNNGAFLQDGNFPGLPGGTYNVYARYTGDSVYAGSYSQPIAVTVSPEITSTEVDAYSITSADVVTGPGVVSFPYGSNVYLDTFVLTTGYYGTPTGTITYTLNNGTNNLAPVVAKLNSYDDAFYQAGVGFLTSDDFFPIVLPNAPVLNAGTYTVSAVYSGDASFLSSTAPSFSIIVTPATAKLKITNETADISPTGSATLLATVTNAAAAIVPGGQATTPASGTFTFVDTTVTPNVTVGSCTAAPVAIAGTLESACTVTTTAGAISTAGAHTITATFTDTDGNYTSGGTATATVTVNATTVLGSSITLATPTTVQVGTSATVTATVAPASGTTKPAGTVAFYLNGQEYATCTLATGTCTGTLASLSAGTYTVTATYGGSTTFSASKTASSVTLVVTPNTPSVVVTAPPVGDIGSGYAIQAVLKTSPNVFTKDAMPTPAPNSVFNFYQGTTLLGSASATVDPTTFNFLANFVTTAVVPGPGTITATFVGDSNYTTSSATENVNIGLTSVAVNVASPALSSTSTSLGTGESVTLQAIVTPSGYNTATLFCTPLTTTPTVTYPTTCGTVSFYDNGTLLGKAAETLPPGSAVPAVAANPLTQTGVATLTTTLTSATTHNITAVYSGDTHFYKSNGALAYTITSTTPYFTIAANPTSLNLTQGATASLAITATVYGNWTGQAPLVCTGLPANSYCTFSYTPNTPPTSGVPLSYFELPGPNGPLYTGTLSITTLVPHAVKGKGAGLLWLPALFLAGLLGFRRKQLSVRARQLTMMALLLCGALATSACGSLGMATPAGTYTVTVTANGVGSTSASPATQPTTTFTLTVAQ